MTRKPLHNVHAELTNNFTNPEYVEEYERLESQFAILNALLTARKEAGLTQKQLADLMGKRQSTIARLESGTHDPKIKTLHQVAKALGKELNIHLGKELKINFI